MFLDISRLIFDISSVSTSEVSAHRSSTTCRVALGGCISGGLAGATYRVDLGGHISGGLSAATYRGGVGGLHVWPPGRRKL